MHDRVKNLRDWAILLFVMFCALDIAALQRGMMVAKTASAHPDPVVGQIVAIASGSRRAWRTVYVTARQETVFYALLGAAGVALIATLAIIVTLGVQLMHASKIERNSVPAARSNRKG